MRITKALLAVVLSSGCVGSISTSVEISAPAEVTLQRGGTVTFEVIVTGGEGDTSAVIEGLPAGVTSTVSRDGAGLLVEFSAASDATAMKYPLTITVTRGKDSASTSVSLALEALSVLAPPSLEVLRGESFTIPVVFERLGGWSGDVSISFAGLPAGVTAAGLTITVADDAQLGTATIDITATAGTRRATTQLQLHVVDFSLSGPQSLELLTGTTATFPVSVSVADFGDPITVTATSLPAGVTSNSEVVTGSGTVQLTLTASATAPAGDSVITVVANGGNGTRTFSMLLRRTGLALSSDTTWRVLRGGSATIPVIFNRENGASGDIALRVVGAPADVDVLPATIDAASSSASLTITAQPTATTTAATLEAETNFGTLTFPISLAITDFAIQTAPTFVVPRGGNRNLTITLDRQQGFDDAVELALQLSAPFAVTSPATIASGSTTHVANVTVDALAAVGSNSVLTINASSGGVTRTVTVALVVGDFTLPTAQPISVSTGTTSIPVTITRVQGYDDDITITATELPVSITATPSTISGTQLNGTLSLEATANCTQHLVTLTATAGGLTRTTPLLLTVRPSSAGGTTVRLAPTSGRPALAAVEDTCPGLFAPVPIGDGGVLEFNVSSTNGRYVLLTNCNGPTLHYATVAERSSGTFDCGVLLLQSHTYFVAQLTGATPGQYVEVATPLFSRGANAPSGSASLQPLFARTSSTTDLAATGQTTSGQSTRATRVFIGRDVSIDGGVATIDLATGAVPTNDPVSVTWPGGAASYFIGEYLELGARSVTLATEYDSAPLASSWVGLAPSRAALRNGEHVVVSASVIAANGDARIASAYSRQQPLPALVFGAAVGDGGVTLAPGGVFDVTLPGIGDERSATISVPGQTTLTVIATPGAVPLGTTLRTPPLELLVPEFTPRWTPDSGVVQWSVTQTEAAQFYTSPVDGKLFKRATKNGTSQP